MKLPIYQIDAFASEPFTGNPAAVVPLDEWLPEHTMQAIAEENNLSETAFFVADGADYRIRWFTPNKEVKLCGHATLATAYVLFNCLNLGSESITFKSLSGELRVFKDGELLVLDFPAQMPEPCDTPPALVDGLGKQPGQCLKREDYVAVFESAEEVRQIDPDSFSLEKLDLRGVIVTAKTAQESIVARFFAPKYGIPEDPVTGSAYTQLVPYWCERNGVAKIDARQLSARGGELFCELKGDRVLIGGKAIKYLEGEIECNI